MIKSKASWWVPLSSFAIAVVLAIVSGPKARMTLRAADAPTGNSGACVCDVKNFSYFTQVIKPDIDAGGDYDFVHGLPTLQTNNSVGNTCKIELKYKVEMPGGLIVHRTTEAALVPTPKEFRVVETGIIETKTIKVKWHGTNADLDAAIVAAGTGMAGGEIFRGEQKGFRNPMIFKFHLHGRVAQSGGGDKCTEDVRAKLPTPLDSFGTGVETGLTP